MASPIEYALAYAAIGWPVFPLEGKRPHAMLGAKGGFKLASRERSTIERWWGQDAAANIGVPCGQISGFWVVDIDPRNSGDVSWQKLLETNIREWDQGIGALVQSTGGGGLHQLFAWDERVRVGKLGEGIDVKRSGGYIVVEPSVTQAPYRFTDWDVLTGEIPPLQPAPEWLLRLVEVPADTRGASASTDRWDTDITKLRAALAFLPADEYLDWISTGAALYHASEGAQAALDEWVQWSRRSSKFAEGACETRWKTFAKYPSKRATLGSIFWRAGQAGWNWRKAKGRLAGGSGEAPPAAGVEASQAAEDPRAIIQWVAGDLPDIVDEAEAALMRSAEGIYQRGGRLVRLVRRESTSVRNFKRAKPADVALRDVDSPYLVEALTRAASWERYDKRAEDWVRINCPEQVATTFLSRSGRWRLPPLLAAITAPTLRPDGTILQKPGYDPSTATWYDPCGFEYPEIDENPTREDAEAALVYLHRALGSFPFAEDVDKSVALALALTAMVRRSLPAAPLGAITAPVMASGKTLLADLIAILASGVPAPAMQLPETDEEAKKVALSILMMGDPVVLIDNIERPLQGDWLCTTLTSESFSGRVLGATQMVHLPTCTLWLATGNQLTIAGDLRTRALLCRIDPQMEKPEQRAFTTDIRVWFTEHRPKLVAAGLTIMRAFIVSGEKAKDHVKPWGRFDAWSDLVRAPLVWLGERDPYLSTAQLDAEDPYRVELQQVMGAWFDRFGDKETTVADAITAALDAHDLKAVPLLEAFRIVAGDRGGTVNARRLGHWLRRHAGRILSGRKIERGLESNHVARWRVAEINTR
jgi:putative DNA primase/helicase